MVSEIEWLSYFPRNTPREQQRIAINEIITFFESDLFEQQVFLLDAPTGVGKGAIGLTIANYFHEEYGFGSNYLIHNKSLEEQMVRDYDNIAHTLGRGNFICKQNGKYCNRGECLLNKNDNYRCECKPKKDEDEDDNKSQKLNPNNDEKKNIWKVPVDDRKNILNPNQLHNLYKNYTKGYYFPYGEENGCGYWLHKVRASRNYMALHNYYYFITEANYIGDFATRYLLICDEGHKIEDIVLNFVSFGLDQLDVERLGYTVMYFEEKPFDKWKEELEKFREYLLSPEFQTFAEKNYGDARIDKKDAIAELHQRVVQELYKFSQFDTKNWIIDYVKDRSTSDIIRIEFKPIEPAEYIMDKLLRFGVKILIMSATLLSKKKTIEVLGLKGLDFQEKVKYLSLGTPFPIKNRQVYYDPIMAMSFKNEKIDSLVEKVSEILKKHENEKGIIHTKSYKLMEQLSAKLNNNRVLIHDSNTRQMVINKYINSDKPYVLISPSIEEGFDLSDELCRFIIIVKIPYLNLGDPQIAARTKKDNQWYSWKAIQTIIQECGRGVRHIEDCCTTYILDSNFIRLFNVNKSYFPQWFIEALILDIKKKEPIRTKQDSENLKNALLEDD